MQTGLDVLVAEGSPFLAGQRVGLISNHTGVDSALHSGVDRLLARREFRLTALFGPEHGLWGGAQAGEHVGTERDARTGLPVHSLYGETRQPTPEMLHNLDVLVYDIQDVGVRYATYISTMALAQEAAAQAGVAFLVLDRPNPLNGERMEGKILDPAFASFVGIHPLPVRHGLTVGELARLFAAERGWSEPLVVPMRGWHRGQWFDETGLPWVQPSPNLPTLDSVTLYPGTCLIEGTNASEGRGTTRPFEVLGAPWVDPFALAEALAARELPGVAFRPLYFVPTFSKHAGAMCGGVQVHVLDRNALLSVELGLHVLHALRSLYPAQFAWRVGGEGRYFIDLLLGSDLSRRALEEGCRVEDLVASWRGPLEAFAARRQPFLLYPRENVSRPIGEEP